MGIRLMPTSEPDPEMLALAQKSAAESRAGMSSGYAKAITRPSSAGRFTGISKASRPLSSWTRFG
jgi:hypothetical protein